MVITQYYGHLQKQMNPHPKFSLVIETNDVMHIPGGYERLITYTIESLRRAGQASPVASGWPRRAGKGAGLVLTVVWGRASRRVPGCRQRLM